MKKFNHYELAGDMANIHRLAINCCDTNARRLLSRLRGMETPLYDILTWIFTENID